MRQTLYDALVDGPIIAAAKNDEQVKRACESDCEVIFLLYGQIENLAETVDMVKEAGKIVFVHMDLVQGLSSHMDAVPFIKKYTKADGIISTKSEVIKKAKTLGFDTVYRIFAIDSKGMSNLPPHLREYTDLIEVMPGLMPKIITKVAKEHKVPVIAGGLISDKEDVVAALDAGALAISSSNEDVWGM